MAIQVEAKEPGEPLPPEERYVLLKGYNQQAVVDKETGLIWERDPNQNGNLPWAQARQVCLNKSVHHKKGWRLHSITELTGVWDPFIVQPASPFIGICCKTFWSSTVDASAPTTQAWTMDTANGFTRITPLSDNMGIWCVKGESPSLQQY
jgi:hypothetical protein